MKLASGWNNANALETTGTTKAPKSPAQHELASQIKYLFIYLFH